MFALYVRRCLRGPLLNELYIIHVSRVERTVPVLTRYAVFIVVLAEAEVFYWFLMQTIIPENCENSKFQKLLWLTSFYARIERHAFSGTLTKYSSHRRLSRSNKVAY